jgi:hypothetical protein
VKIEWRSHSLHATLSARELEALASAMPVRESLGLHHAGWEVVLRVAPPGVESSISADGSRVTMLLSRLDCARLASPQAEGIYVDDERTHTRYFVEKDLAGAHSRRRLDARNEPGETFAAPPASNDFAAPRGRRP